ncbi:vitamin K epoxide reductase family protein [Caldalkalibacillus mannanilyticus]|uniref:vitamin K epoxide reductase family protein n=1 Tax=Caldalkalibacillus mannanilyticus TaxID=1418 RepID=UPI0034E28A3B
MIGLNINYELLKKILLIFGIIVTLYLYINSANFSNNGIICPTNGCSEVNSSKYAQIVGIPVSLIGLLGYITMFNLNLFAYKIFIHRIYLFCLFFSFLFSTYLTLISLLIIRATCFWCIVSFCIIIALMYSEVKKRRKYTF